MKNLIFVKKKILPSKDIFFSIVSLEKWSLVKVSGKNKKEYLQSQFTADINDLKSNKYFFCGHCNNRGRIYSTLLLFKRNKKFFYILRKSVIDQQIKAIKKYSIFSQVKFIKEKKLFFIGVIGKNSRNYLKKIFKILPNKNNSVIQNNDITIIWIKNIVERFILISSRKNLIFFLKKFKNIALFNNSNQWLSIDIEEKIPIIDFQNILKFFPQEINLHKFKNGISFNKGCYIGQEQISKIKYNQINKQSLQVLYCFNIKNKFFPGDLVYVKIKESWIKKGILLSFVLINKKILYAQIVLNKFFKKKKYKIQDSYFYLRK